MIPGISLNCLLTSAIILKAAFPTASIVKDEKRNGNIAPINNPIITLGLVRLIIFRLTAEEKAANKDSAVKAAEPIAKPLPIAAVVFPTESNLSVLSLTSDGSSAISAIPPALSAIGP